MLVKIKDIGNIVTGKTPSTKSIDNFNGDIPFITPEDVFKGFIIRTTRRCLTEKGFISIKNNTINEPSVLVGCIGSDMGRVAISLGKAATNQQINSVTKIKPNFDIMYVYYLFLHNRTRFRRLADSSTSVPILSKSDFSNIEFDIPNLDTQRKIAEIMFSIDEQIEKNNGMVNKLQVLAQSTFHYFFAIFSSKKEPLSSFIVEHKKSMLQVNEVEDAKGIIPFFTSGDTVKYIHENLVDGFNLFLSTGGNASVKAYYGKASYSTDTWCITAKNDMQFYIFEYLKMIENQMDSLYFHGTGLKHLQKPLFLNSEIPVPNENLSKYNAIVEPIFRKISKIKEATIKLNNLKNTLLPLLINQQLQ